MITKPIKYVLVDLNTQRDFFLAAGACCIRNHRRVLARIRRIMAWARANKIAVISMCEVYPSNGSGRHHYIDGAWGQRKIGYALFNNRVSFPAEDSTDLPMDLLRRYRQVILHKRCLDPFDEPRIDRLLSMVRTEEFILIGATAERAVLATALGLLQRGRNVTVVTDAVGCHDNREAKLALRKMEAKGARFIETGALAGTSHLQRVGICHCEMCKGRKAKARRPEPAAEKSRTLGLSGR